MCTTSGRAASLGAASYTRVAIEPTRRFRSGSHSVLSDPLDPKRTDSECEEVAAGD